MTMSETIVKASELKPGQIGEWAGMYIAKTFDGQYLFQLNGQQKVSSELPMDVEVTIQENIKLIPINK